MDFTKISTYYITQWTILLEKTKCNNKFLIGVINLFYSFGFLRISIWGTKCKFII